MEYKAFVSAAWTEFTNKCKALFPFLKKTFVGTRAEWDALTTAEKQVYDVCNLTDDVAGGDLIVSDEVTEGDLNPVTSNAVYGEIYHEKQAIPYTSATTLYTEVTGLYPSAVHRTNVYIVTARSAEAYIMICGIGDAASMNIPIIKQLNVGASKLKFYWDADEKTVAISSNTYNVTYIQQISGDIAELTFSDASITNPLTNPTEITVTE